MNMFTVTNDTVEISVQTADLQGFRLSPQQSRCWSLQQLAGRRSPYRVQATVLLEGQLEVAALAKALRRVVLRHEILRTVFQQLPGMTLPVQVIQAEPAYALTQHDVAHLSVQEQEHLVARLQAEMRSVPFDFAHGPLLQLSLVALSAAKYLLLICLPALYADEAGLAALLRELWTTYAALTGSTEEAAGEALQYADIAEVLNELIESEESGGRAFWLKQSFAASADLHLPFEAAADGAQGFTPQVFSRALAPALVEQL